MTTHEIELDVETQSAKNLPRVGAHIYAADPSTDLVCAAFAVDDGAPETWIPPAPCPSVIARVVAENWPIHAHHATFERLIWHHILTPRYGWPEPCLAQWRCSMAAALANALPGGLETAAAALELPFRKDPDGRKAMLRLSDARKPPKAGDLELTCRYNRGDVEQARALRRKLPPLSPSEQCVWQRDAIINDRGFFVDVELARAAEQVVEQERAAINDKITALTGGAINSVNKVAKITAFVRARGHQLKGLTKRSVSAVLARNPDAETRQLLELRRDGGRSSTAKLNALFTHVGADNRIRGALKFHAASTGRWSGNGFQPHNLKRVETKSFDVDAAINAVLTHDLAKVREFGPPLTIIGDVMRGLICAPPGRCLVCCDLSTIEARILSWYSNETWKLDAFREYDRTGDPALEPYLIAAARILKRSVDPDDEIDRHVGKTGELAFGYGGGARAWRNFDASDNHTDADVEGFKQEWRRAHPATTRFWRRLESSIKKAIRTGGRVTLDDRLVFKLENETLYLTLPSGRRLSYPKARLTPGKFKDTTAVAFHDNARGGWTEVRGWFGIFVENVVSGTARDLLAAILLRVDAPVTLHVHDEIVIEAPEDFTDGERFRRSMTELPDWAAGLPIAAKVRIGKRYSKSAKVKQPQIAVIDADEPKLEYADDF